MGKKIIATLNQIVIIILLCLMIFVALGKTDEEKLSKINEFLKGIGTPTFNLKEEDLYNPERVLFTAKFYSPEEMSSLKETIKNKENMRVLFNHLKTFINENSLGSFISLDVDEKGMFIVLRDDLLFDTADANLKKMGEETLLKLVLLLEELDNDILVEGHTDNIPIHTDKYQSNWELSTARASSVIRFLVDYGKIKDNRFTAVGYAETKPLVDNSSDENREKNRRVVIYVMQK